MSGDDQRALKRGIDSSHKLKNLPAIFCAANPFALLLLWKRTRTIRLPGWFIINNYKRYYYALVNSLLHLCNSIVCFKKTATRILLIVTGVTLYTGDVTNFSIEHNSCCPVVALNVHQNRLEYLLECCFLNCFRTANTASLVIWFSEALSGSLPTFRSMGASQAKPDVRLPRHFREELLQNEPLRKSIAGTEKSASEQWGPWQGQDGLKKFESDAAAAVAAAEEEFRRRASSVNSTDMEPNWWHKNGEHEYQREVIRKHSAAVDSEIPRNWWFPSTVETSIQKSNVVTEMRGWEQSTSVVFVRSCCPEVSPQGLMNVK